MLARPKQIRVTHWLDGTIKLIDVYEDETAFEGFMSSIENAFLLNDSFRVYALAPPSYTWEKRCKVEKCSFGDVLSKVTNINAPLSERLRLYMLPTDISPESSPLQPKRTENDETDSAISGATNTSRPGQEDFRKRTRFRDNGECVFCQFNGEPLYAGHILPYSPYKTDKEAFTRWGISGIHDTCNGLTLCWNCHQAFDNDLACISATDGTLVVAQALQETEPTKWKKLHGKRVTSMSPQWPQCSLLQYRVDQMNVKAEERKSNREVYPYRCRECNAGCKTLSGLLNRHAGSEKCASKQGKMSSYSTPAKFTGVIDEEEIIFG